MNYKQIESFHYYMVEGSVTKAARKLGKTQPAVSRHLADLEQSVNMTLFVRSGNSLVPTAEATLLHKEVQRSFIGFQELKRRADAIANQQVGQIVVTAQPVYIDTFLIPIVAEFQAEHKAVSVQLHDEGHENMLHRVSSGRCDFGLGITLNLARREVDVEPISSCSAVCVLPVSHPLAGCREVNIEQLHGERFVELSIGSPLRTRVDHLFLRNGMTRHIIAEARTMRAVCSLVEWGCGIAIADPCITPYIDRSKATVVEVTPAIDWSIAIFRPKNTPLDGVSRSFYDILVKSAAEHLRG